MKYLFIWSLTPKLYELSLNLSIGIALINYLGPVEQGKIGFLINLCTLMSFLTTLGIGPVYSNFVSRSNNERLISNKFKENVTLRFLGYILFLLVSLLFLFFFKRGLIYLSIPFLIGKLFFSFDIYYNLIEGKAGFKNYAISKFISLTCINVFRLYCIYAQLDIYWVAFSFFLTDFLTFFVYFLLFDKFKYFGFKFDYKKSLIIFKINYKLALSTIVVSLFTQLDIVMIGTMLGDKAAGEYYASTRLATPLVFISTIIISTFFSKLSRNWVVNKKEYYELLAFISRSIIFSYSAIVLIIFIFGNDIFFLFFSSEYKASYDLFLIHIVGLIFVLLGPLTGKHLIIKKDYGAELSKTLLAAIVNIALTSIAVLKYENLNLVAVSTLISYMIANFGYFIVKKDWLLIKAILNGVNPLFLVRYAKKIL